MTDHDDLIKELGTALKVQPSTAFADGVRARIDRSKARITQMWWGLAAAATVGFAVMALWRPSHEVPAPVTTIASEPAPRATPALAPVTAPIPSVGGRVFRPGDTPTLRSVSRSGKASVVRVAATTDAEPRLEVITNQGEVLRQLWADVRGRTLVLAEVEPIVDGLSPKPIEVNPVEVRPIVVNEIGKEPVPAGASPIIRRANATKETK
jgi:hypothetical protein